MNQPMDFEALLSGPGSRAVTPAEQSKFEKQDALEYFLDSLLRGCEYLRTVVEQQEHNWDKEPAPGLDAHVLIERLLGAFRIFCEMWVNGSDPALDGLLEAAVECGDADCTKHGDQVIRELPWEEFIQGVQERLAEKGAQG